jgi:sulfate adenylyltransferase
MATTTTTAPNHLPIKEYFPTDAEEVKKLKQDAQALKSIALTQRQLCDIEMLLNGAFNPLTGFMNQADYEGVVKEMRMANGTLFPMPITLDLSKDQITKLGEDKRIALLDQEGNPIAILDIESIYEPNKQEEALGVFGTTDVLHPAVYYLFNNAGTHYVGGKVTGIQLPIHYDYVGLRRTPNEVRKLFAEKGWARVVAFQTRNPLHRSHYELTVRATKKADAHLFLNPVVGMTKPGDIDHHTRVRCYKNLMTHYPDGLALLSLLPLAMRMGGPREAVWHMIIRKNFGATHFIIGRDHAGPGNNAKGESFYDPYAAQKVAEQHAKEIGIEVLMFQQVVFVPDLNTYLPEDELKEGMVTKNISGTALRNHLMKGIPIPEWFSFPSVIKILTDSYPPLHKQGFTLFFTGLSGSGKSTISNAVMVRLMELTSRTITLLDGDVVRHHLSSELGFSKEHRDLNIKRIGYVASEITKAGGIAISAAIAPYVAARNCARELVTPNGGFLEIHVSTPIEVCENRDRKGLYAKARNGQLKGFTGIDDPYEPPEKAEIIIDSSKYSVRDATELIISTLIEKGYLVQNESGSS